MFKYGDTAEIHGTRSSLDGTEVKIVGIAINMVDVKIYIAELPEDIRRINTPEKWGCVPVPLSCLKKVES